jgi:hypothetical protein
MQGLIDIQDLTKDNIGHYVVDGTCVSMMTEYNVSGITFLEPLTSPVFISCIFFNMNTPEDVDGYKDCRFKDTLPPETKTLSISTDTGSDNQNMILQVSPEGLEFKNQDNDVPKVVGTERKLMKCNPRDWSSMTIVGGVVALFTMMIIIIIVA